jgi:outer membrane receptor protein involved in Fe transport
MPSHNKPHDATALPLPPRVIGACALAMAVLAARAQAQTTAPAADAASPKLSINPFDNAPKNGVYGMSLEDLMNVEVSSVSRMAQNISQAAAAITVIDQDQIRRSGMTSIPDLLRLVPGMDVGRVAPGKWAISTRGFQSQYSDKLLVLMDGRTIYDPLFSGVFWDRQDYVLADLEKIEVIRGPGATMWGSNAVNGVINITSKSARDTQGFLIDALGGTLESNISLRYGGKIGNDTYYRVYGKFANTSDFQNASGTHMHDGMDTTRTGFRIDKYADAQNTITLQGDYQYSNVQGIAGVNLDTLPGGSSGNLLGRWTHTESPESGFALQLYYDHVDRFSPQVINYRHDVVDLADDLRPGARERAGRPPACRRRVAVGRVPAPHGDERAEPVVEPRTGRHRPEPRRYPARVRPQLRRRPQRAARQPRLSLTCPW